MQVDLMTDREVAALCERLRVWAPLVGSGYEVPAASHPMFDAAATIEAFAARLAKVEAEIERLRAALEPFAKACVKAEANAEQQARLGLGIMTDKASPGWGIQYGHLKAARAALQGQSND